MKHISLATRYRPQTFADVAGQELVTSVLSRAAAEDRVAPAYLLSGTRGVGKTTIARILAKALNCTTAPTGEPCNQCEQCRKITQGNHVDVTEIDGASNNSVEDARALRENIGYAPMEGRYKVFIIDEAHMLSRSAFNALLKTLEEPPPRVVFVFATTEAHKFPITIVSRCQHFIFRRVPEAGLIAHLNKVLQAESIPCDEGAVRLIARRASGSVRDAMSLLGQTLALGGESLSVEATRSVLGLAGQDFFARLVEALVNQDCVSLTKLVREILDQGVDIGFFLRELTALWRTLFLIRQAGEAILPVLDLPEDEARQWCALAPRLSLTHIHAAWQMVLDAQRRVIHSPEPAAALELLLLNVALLPRLLPLVHMQGGESGGAAPFGAKPTGSNSSVPISSGPVSAGPALTSAGHAGVSSPTGEPKGQSGAPNYTAQPVTGHAHSSPLESETLGAEPPDFGPPDFGRADFVPVDAGYADAEHIDSQYGEFSQEYGYDTDTMPPAAFSDSRTGGYAAASQVTKSPVSTAAAKSFDSPAVSDISPDTGAIANTVAVATQAISNPTWEGFFDYCIKQGNGQCPQHVLRQTKGTFAGDVLTLSTAALTLYQQLDRSQETLHALLKGYSGRDMHIIVAPPTQMPKTEAELKADFAQREELKPLIEIFDARISRCPPIANNHLV